LHVSGSKVTTVNTACLRVMSTRLKGSLNLLSISVICHIAGAMRTWGTSLDRAGIFPRIFPNYKMTWPQKCDKNLFNTSAWSVGKNSTDCCQLDADLLHTG